MPNPMLAAAALAALTPTLPEHDEPNAPRHAPPVVTEYAAITELGSLGGGYTEAKAVNDLGQVVGFSFDAYGRRRAFFWDSTIGMVDLNMFIAPADRTRWTLRSADGISNGGYIVGSGFYLGDHHRDTRAFRILLPGFNPSPPDCPADRTSSSGGPPDGIVNIFDLNDFMERYAIESAPGYTGPITCDYSGPDGLAPDGKVNIYDLNYYLSLWQASLGPCPQ